MFGKVSLQTFRPYLHLHLQLALLKRSCLFNLVYSSRFTELSYLYMLTQLNQSRTTNIYLSEIRTIYNSVCHHYLLEIQQNRKKNKGHLKIQQVLSYTKTCILLYNFLLFTNKKFNNKIFTNMTNIITLKGVVRIFQRDASSSAWDHQVS